MIWIVVGLVFTAGCIGGLINSLVAGELRLPYLDSDAKVYRPGWVGNVLVGGVAALVLWGLYGPMAHHDLIAAHANETIALTVAELFGALVTGVGGGRLLSAEISRRALQVERDALDETKRTLADGLSALVETKR